ncbi:hypothetical protein DXG03_000679 [Asterophora parasitica]|uniref:Pre-mRNA polyadenylation factor Fip1 domain-containing protein n=1 Tax=Asterophora parasitica TaxID=117018 RepID=A0A9P7G4S4_9AGAR|nr:hypothetical protein DXG03_000679 [Asterophora parasitica]
MCLDRIVHTVPRVSRDRSTPPANGAVPTHEPDDDLFGTREPPEVHPALNGDRRSQEQQGEEEEAEEEEEEEEVGEESDDEDIEIITEPAQRSLDFRQQRPDTRAPVGRTPSTTIPTQPRGQFRSSSIPASSNSRSPAPQPTLTTEYTPISRGGPSEGATQAPSQAQAPSQHAGPSFAGLSAATASQPAPSHPENESLSQTQNDSSGVDASTLPPVTAPSSHPAIDPSATGVLDGRSILDVDLGAMGEKPWRRPGSDISDWFNYGFDEISWEAYCYRRRELGELANVLKTNVINFSGMQEDQLTALPPEVRQMVMTGTTAMMNGAGNAGMMGPGVMMDMGMMGPMGMGMDMGMGGPMMQMQQDGGGMQQGGVGVGVGNNGTPEQSVGVQGGVGMMQQDGFVGGQGQGDMMNMGMGGEYGMQNPMGQQMYQAMDSPQQQQVAAPTPVQGGRGAAPAAYRGRGQGLNRGRGFAARGRGRGGGFGGDGAPPPVPVRPASPLPPGVPTGPRNQNKYKDRDGNAPAVDGLDYGGTNKDFGRTSSGEPEDRSMSR